MSGRRRVTFVKVEDPVVGVKNTTHLCSMSPGVVGHTTHDMSSLATAVGPEPSGGVP